MRLPMNPFLKRNEVCVDVPHKPALGMALEIEGETPRPSTLGESIANAPWAQSHWGSAEIRGFCATCAFPQNAYTEPHLVR